jgi:hypothetical protein
VPRGQAATFIGDTRPEPPTSGYLSRSDADVGVALTAGAIPAKTRRKSAFRIGPAEDQQPERLLHAMGGRVATGLEEALDPHEGGMFRQAGNEDDRGFR